MKSFGASCIIPFYNEAERILGVLDAVSKVKEFDQIFCVDDGSTDSSKFNIKSSKFINKKKFPQFRFFRFSKNRGKSEAVEKALQEARNLLIFLVDGDLKSLNPKEIEKGINIMKNHDDIDMLILKRVHTHIQGTWHRANTVFSGERIIRMQDLLKLFNSPKKPHRYELETAINQYMIDERKKVYWIPSSAINHFKREKYGDFILGEIKDLHMHWTMIKYVGLFNYLKQIVFFCWKQYHPSNFAN